VIASSSAAAESLPCSREDPRPQQEYSRSSIPVLVATRRPSDLTRMTHRGVASRTRERRQRVGTTQQRAQIIGVAFQQAYRDENGLSRVSASRLYHIASPLDASVSNLSSPGRGLVAADEANDVA
jgi:hypothetical protein